MFEEPQGANRLQSAKRSSVEALGHIKRDYPNIESEFLLMFHQDRSTRLKEPSYRSFSVGSSFLTLIFLTLKVFNTESVRLDLWLVIGFHK